MTAGRDFPQLSWRWSQIALAEWLQGTHKLASLSSLTSCPSGITFLLFLPLPAQPPAQHTTGLDTRIHFSIISAEKPSLSPQKQAGCPCTPAPLVPCVWASAHSPTPPRVLLVSKMYLILAALGLCCCTWTFPSCCERGLLSSCNAASGLSRCSAQALGHAGFSTCGAQALWPRSRWDLSSHTRG